MIVKFLLTITSLFSVLFISQDKISGGFYRPSKGGGCIVELNNNGTYKQTIQDCTWGFSSNGTWTTNNDTIYLEARNLYSRSGKKLNLIAGKTDCIKYNQMRKFYFRNDTLYLVRNGKLVFPMIKEKTKSLQNK